MIVAIGAIAAAAEGDPPSVDEIIQRLEDEGTWTNCHTMASSTWSCPGERTTVFVVDTDESDRWIARNGGSPCLVGDGWWITAYGHEGDRDRPDLDAAAVRRVQDMFGGRRSC